MKRLKSVSVDLIDRIEQAVQYIECAATIDLLRDAEEEIEQLRKCKTVTDKSWRDLYAENVKLRKIVNEYAPHRLGELDHD